MSTSSTETSHFVLTNITPIALFIPLSVSNTHHMVTWSKIGTFKPKDLSVEVVDYEPRTIAEVFASKEWHLAA